MPRKVNYGVDYDDDYDYYEDDEYDFDVEENGKAPESKQETVKPGVWRCSICTYDNKEGMFFCDICGVLRRSGNNCGKNDKGTVDGISKHSRASMMAKSLFASMPHRKPKRTVVWQGMNDTSFMTEGSNNFLKLENIQGHYGEFHEAFSTRNHVHIDIAPFKFDVPSPDDMVSGGKLSSKLSSKANLLDSKSSRGSSTTTKKAVNEQSSTKSMDGNRMSKNAVVNVPSSSKGLEALMPKGGPFSGDEGNSSKDSEVNTKSSGKRSDSSSKRGILNNISCSSTNADEQHNIASDLKNMSLNTNHGNSSTVNSGRANLQAHYKPEKWMLPEKGKDVLTQLNLAIVGHVDSGKSTLSGRLLHLLGRISQREMHKYEKEAKLQGKGSFAYAWALDESAEERERGITMNVAVAYFDSKNYHVVILDSPGHKDFVPNMIAGATQADAAILVIDASIGSFEAGMDSGKGQTREHAQLIKSFGVDQIIVAVNKMDVMGYSKDRFDLIKLQLGTFLRSCNFKDSSVSWIPLSAMQNQNLVAAPSDTRLLSWYKGPNLLEAIDCLQPPARDFAKPLRMPICDVIRLPSQGQVSASGKLEAGALRSGMKVLVMPSGDIGTVRSLERDSQACAIARAGDNVAVSLQGIEASHVMAGGVLCHPDFSVAVAKRLELKVLVLDGATPILIGSQLEFHIHHAKEAAQVARIVSLLDPKTGEVTKKAPRCLTPKQRAVVEVVLQAAVCVEEFSSCKALGRVYLRALGRTIAVGMVTRIIEEQD